MRHANIAKEEQRMTFDAQRWAELAQRDGGCGRQSALTTRPTPEQKARREIEAQVESILRSVLKEQVEVIVFEVLVEQLPGAVEYILARRQGGQNEAA
jgi:hypothetical protein